MKKLNDLKKELQSLANPKKAKLLQGFFKTSKGEYGEGDIFLGIIVPLQRKVSKEYDLSLEEIQELLNNNIHEYRLTALFILIKKYNKAKKAENEELKKEIFDFYLKNTKKVNNWDLVDLSSPNIIGDFLLDKQKEREILYRLANSSHLWEKRISMLACAAFIREKDFNDALKIAEVLLKDNHDLIHKAVGWMLREIGKRNQEVEEEFLKKHYKTMPRTMLRYAIEKFPKEKKEFYMRKI